MLPVDKRYGNEWTTSQIEGKCAYPTKNSDKSAANAQFLVRFQRFWISFDSRLFNVKQTFLVELM
jgi:hypothetical protein